VLGATIFYRAMMDGLIERFRNHEFWFSRVYSIMDCILLGFAKMAFDLSEERSYILRDHHEGGDKI